MATITQDNTIRVQVAPDKMSAEMIIPAGFDFAVATDGFIEALLRQAGLDITEAVQDAVNALLQAPPEHPQTVRGVIAHGTPPQHGEDGRVDWLVDQHPDEDDNRPASHYDRTAFIMVKPGQVIGRLHRPTIGTDGRDVCGRTLAARDGKDCRLKLDETILRKANGDLVAQAEGLLHRDRDAACIRNFLEVSDNVDFSTGNIDFRGDIAIRNDVKDCFVVRATGHVEVHGMIEAATIECGGDLIARGGFAGREQGRASVGGSLRGKYLDNIHAEARGDLCIDREVINCRLVIHGRIDSPAGSIIGGQTVVTGAAHIAALGSPAGVPTELVVGTVPRLEPFADELARLADDLRRQHDALAEEQDRINKLSGKKRMTAVDKERQTEIAFELMQVGPALRKAEATLANLQALIERERTVDVRVERRLHNGVVFVFAGNHYRIQREVRGPVRIARGDRGEAVFEHPDGTGGLLAQIADVSTGTR